ncbi:DUF4232 domain-containing protein [Acetobacter senegalensis]|uniref:DUF4232 domain-containing protein n=1 Tax=Acetobacter senegalensis TaxID=446692 RepID=UPI00128C6BA3|nr:DUF4232 domain-containing protein [Acetobacter senegalensis]MPQ72926.1 DUF4232 domain-containing protein [Acetobacter senegalensis]
MKKIIPLVLTACFVSFVGLECTSAASERIEGSAAPSSAEKRVIAERIGAVKNAQDRAAIENQSPVWKMTTFLCQDAARSVLEEKGAGRRFFLQDDKPESQVFVGPELLTGRGQFSLKKDAMQWVPFTWACHLDPKTAKVIRFDVAETREADTAEGKPPVCQAKDLHLTLDAQNGAFNGMSHSGTMVILKNTTAHACSVPAYPAVELQDSAGRNVSAHRQTESATAWGQTDSLSHQDKASVTLPADGTLYTALRWVSGDVYDGSHNCVTAAALQLIWDDGRQSARVPMQAHVCAPAQQSAQFEQTPLSAHSAMP